MIHTDRILPTLSQLGLYRLGRGGALDAELAAYRAGLDLLIGQADAMLDDAFVQTASPARLADWERLLDLPLRSDVAADARRQIILLRRAVRGDDYTLEGMLRALEASGLRATIIEDIDQRKLTVVGQEFLGSFDSIHDVMEQAGKMLPAHLQCDFDIGSVTWLKLEALTYLWNFFDNLHRTWEQLDIALI